MSNHLDDELIKKIQPYLIADYEVLDYTRQPGLRDAFISGAVRDVNLKYQKPAEIDFTQVFLDLEVIAQEVSHAELVIRHAYEPKLEEIKNKYLLLEASANHDDELFLTQSKELYGMPKEHYYLFALTKLRKLIAEIDSAFLSNPKVVDSIEKLKPLLEKAEDFNNFEDFSFNFSDTHLGPSYIMTAVEIKQACEEAFVKYGIEGWCAVISPPGARLTFNTSQEQRIVYIPNDADASLRKFPLTKKRVEGLIAHEIGTHVVRRENGMKSPLALLGIGLAGYLPGEEGIATYNEQRATGVSHLAGGLGYLAISWAVGLDGTPRNFRDLFEVMSPYLFLSVVKQLSLSDLPLDFDDIERKVKRNAWARCIRTFRGTSGLTPGCCLTRDIIYLEGNIAILDLLKTEPAKESEFYLGKYDPTKKQHLSILRELCLL